MINAVLLVIIVACTVINAAVLYARKKQRERIIRKLQSGELKSSDVIERRLW